MLGNKKSILSLSSSRKRFSKKSIHKVHISRGRGWHCIWSCAELKAPYCRRHQATEEFQVWKSKNGENDSSIQEEGGSKQETSRLSISFPLYPILFLQMYKEDDTEVCLMCRQVKVKSFLISNVSKLPVLHVLLHDRYSPR